VEHGPELKDMHGFAEDFAAVLGRPVTYVPEEVETWNETYVDTALAEFPHTAEHMKTLTRLMGGGGYRGATDQLDTLIGRPPKTVRWALENHPRIRKLAAAG
jgi:NAD(P)H dehydrogenase (quinone)